MKRFCFLLLAFAMPSCGQRGPSAPANVPQKINSFIIQKEKHAQNLASLRPDKVPADVWNYFRLAREGKWGAADRVYQNLRKRREGDSVFTSTTWSALLDVQLTLDAYVGGEPKYPTAFGEGVVNSVPRGSIYFGGTDPGRGLPTAFSDSHADGVPFFTITQNALADSIYLNYLTDTYGSKIQTPTTEDSQQCFQAYLEDAQKRLDHDRHIRNEPRQIKPGEDISIVDNKVKVGGQVAVMAINARLTKVIFDKNPEREFYIEESFPLDWMYPHLAPHGLIMKLHREPLQSIPPEVIAKDREFWTQQLKGTLGGWLTPDTPVQEICSFVEKVLLKKDLAGFQGDPAFIRSDYAMKLYSKLRSSIGGVYNWRIANSKTPDEQQRMIQEGDFAFRQAFVLCPYSPEAVFRYVNLLVQLQRTDDALLIARTAAKFNPKDGQTQSLIVELERIRSTQPKGTQPPTSAP